MLDLAANSDNSYTPAYGIWENGVLARVLLHERPTRVQDAGVAVTLAAVLAIAAG